MKLLYILGAYKPNASANGICSDNVIQALAQAGYDITVLCNRYADVQDFSVEPNGVKVYRIKQRLFLRLQDWVLANKASHPMGSKMVSLIASIINKAQLFVMSSQWPLISPGYTRNFYKKAKQLHEKEKFDIVVGVYKPFDALLAAHKLKKDYPDLLFVPYYLDALAGGWGPNSWSEKRTSRATQKWEYQFNSNADLIVSMNSSKHYHETRWTYPTESFNRKYLDVPMLLPAYKAEKTEKGKRKVALFAGNLSYPRRNPIPLLEIFKTVCNELDMELVFAGACNNTAIFSPYINATGGRIKVLGQLSHDKVTDLEGQADYLINIGSENPYTIPGKIFEYIRFNKPIISTFCIDDEPSIEYLKKYQNAFFADERKPFEATARALIKFLTQEEMANSNIDCSTVFYTNTPRAFVDLLNEFTQQGEVHDELFSKRKG
ncbi:MAG: hypothetical protein IKC95_06380 [Oscillospiraceae bacterium]|nr:hypothetical protein [Oscillospiraceae bacterium]